MDGPITIPADDNTKQTIQTSIRSKLSEITNTKVDDVLPEYVMVMVVNQKTKSQVAADLEAFLGDQQAQTFTNWLWSALHSMISDSAAKSDTRRQPQKEDELMSSREIRREDTRRDREPSPSRSVFASVITVPPERQRTAIDNPAPSRLILNAVQDAVRSTSNPTPSRHLDSPEPRGRDDRDYRDNNNHRDNYRDNHRDNNYRDNHRDNFKERVYHTRHNRDNRSRENVMDRLGSRGNDFEVDNRRSRDDRRPRGRDSPTISSRLGDSPSNLSNNNNVYLPDANKRKLDGEGAAEGETPVTFTVTLNGVKDDDDPVNRPLKNKRRSYEPDEGDNEDEEVEGGGKKVKKVRCQFWPNCTRGEECIYFHPTQQCKLFPNCTLGDTCLYIHPSVPCKFGVKCTRADCAFSHPSRAVGVASALPTSRTPSFAPPGVKPCKNGFACEKRTDGCSFYHPPTACMFGEACERPGCTFAHGKLCRSGVACTTPGCSFVHGAQINTQCKFGAGCLNTSCRFLHDDVVATKPADESMGEAEDTSDISASLPKTPPTVVAAM